MKVDSVGNSGASVEHPQAAQLSLVSENVKENATQSEPNPGDRTSTAKKLQYRYLSLLPNDLIIHVIF